LDPISQELVNRLIFLHNFEDPINERYFSARILQVPDQLVEGLDGYLLLPTLLGCILDKVANHLKVFEVLVPLRPRKFLGVLMDKAAPLGYQCFANVISKANSITVW
jgi:hypothetical protein